MAGNVIVGGLIGVAVDAMSGATKKLTPNPVKLTLEPVAVQCKCQRQQRSPRRSLPRRRLRCRPWSRGCEETGNRDFVVDDSRAGPTRGRFRLLVGDCARSCSVIG